MLNDRDPDPHIRIVLAAQEECCGKEVEGPPINSGQPGKRLWDSPFFSGDFIGWASVVFVVVVVAILSFIFFSRICPPIFFSVSITLVAE